MKYREIKDLSPAKNIVKFSFRWWLSPIYLHLKHSSVVMSRFLVIWCKPCLSPSKSSSLQFSSIYNFRNTSIIHSTLMSEPFQLFSPVTSVIVCSTSIILLTSVFLFFSNLDLLADLLHKFIPTALNYMNLEFFLSGMGPKSEFLALHARIPFAYTA